MHTASGKITFDFWINDKLAEKKRVLNAVIEDARKRFNVSMLEVDEFEDAEKGVLGFSLVASTEKGAEEVLKRFLEYVDSHAAARVVAEDSEIAAFD